MAEYLLVRVAGLPFSALAALGSPRARRTADRADRLARALQEGRQALLDRLYAAVGGETDPERRRLLLAVRRDVFNGRVPPRPHAVRRLAAMPGTDAATGRMLRRWLSAVRRRDALLRRGDRSAERDRQAARRGAAALWADPAVRSGLLFAQPALFRELAAGGWDAKTERALQAYLVRMATKTSPFSAFTATGIGRLGPPGRGFGAVGARAPASTFTLNAGVVESLADALSTHPELRRHLPLRENETAYGDGDELHFLARTPAGESVMSVGRTPVVELLLALAAGSGLTLAALPGRLAALLPDPGLRDAVAAVAEQLAALGLIRARPDYDAADPGVLASLAEAACPGAAEAACALARAQEAMDALAAAAPDRREAALAAVADRVGHALAALGSARTAAPAEQNLVHHDCHLRRGCAVPRDLLAAREQALGRIAGILPLFNTDLAAARRVQAFFDRRFGPGAPPVGVLEFFRRFCEEAADPGGGGAVDPFGAGDGAADPSLPARGALVAELRARAARAEGVLELPASFLERWGRAARPFLPPLAPAEAAFLCQFAMEGDGPPLLVLNRVAAGRGMLFSRVAGGEADGEPRQWLAGALRRRLAAADPEATVVELAATLGFAGQLRPRITPRCLAYPGEAVGRPAGERIPWREVAVAFDPARGAARLVRTGTGTGEPLLPVHLGTLSALFFPPFYRLLTAFGPAFTPDLPLLELMEAEADGERGAEIRAWPRIQHGGVVLVRRSWSVPAAALPPERSGEGEFAAFRRLRAWAAEAGFPRRVFVTPMRTGEYLRSGLPGARFRRLHKPFYVDWEEIPSHRLFRRYTATPGATLTVSEMLPLPGQVPPGADGDPRATEHVFEMALPAPPRSPSRTLR
jgi:hypothetical protein